MAITKVSPNLRFLSMIGLSRVSDHGFSQIAENCTHLQTVVLKKRFSYAGGGVRATDDSTWKSVWFAYSLSHVCLAALVAFAKHCKDIRVFHCAGMLRVTNVGVIKFVKACNSELFRFAGHVRCAVLTRNSNALQRCKR